MNKRIRALAEQAGIHFEENKQNRIHFIGTATLERFAESVVQECVGVSLESSHRNDDMGAIIAREIEKHFGVKE